MRTSGKSPINFEAMQKKLVKGFNAVIKEAESQLEYENHEYAAQLLESASQIAQSVAVLEAVKDGNKASVPLTLKPNRKPGA